MAASLVSILGVFVLRAAVTASALDEEGGAKPNPAPPSSAPTPLAEPEVVRPPLKAPSRHQLVFSAGFSHWYGDTLGAPVGTYTPGLAVGVRPGIPWIEVGLHYTLSAVELSLPNGSQSHIGFASAEFKVTREMRYETQRLVVGCGPHIGFVHTREGIGFEGGAGLLARYLVDVGDILSVGPFFEARALLYKLPGSSKPIYEWRDGKLVAGHSDAQIHLGVAVTGW
jgi:hypothetical protein